MTEEEQKELLDVLFGVILQACSVGYPHKPDWHLDSMALSYYSDGIRMLAKHGLVKIDSDYGAQGDCGDPMTKDEIRLLMVKELDEALHGTSVARDASPWEVWMHLLDEVRRLAVKP